MALVSVCVFDNELKLNLQSQDATQYSDGVQSPCFTGELHREVLSKTRHRPWPVEYRLIWDPKQGRELKDSLTFYETSRDMRYYV